MKKGRFSRAQIVAILQQQASGQTVAQFVCEHGLSEATFYAWKSTYAGASVTELTRLKHLEEENERLKQMFAYLSLENQTIKKVVSPVAPGSAGLTSTAGVCPSGPRGASASGQCKGATTSPCSRHYRW
ncbi:MAG: IS66 family insertion sequence element accessory protein TnpA [Janthinobacterium lividum]